MQHVASRCTRCEGYVSIAFGLAQVDSVALAKTKGLLPCGREDRVRAASCSYTCTSTSAPHSLGTCLETGNYTTGGWGGKSVRKLAFWGGWGEKMSETRVLDRMNLCSLQIKVFGPFWELILSETRVLDRINFFSL